MAKKADNVDATIYVKTLVDAGMDEATAKERIDKLIEKVNEVMPGESIESRNNIVAIKTRELVSASRSEKYTMTVVAVGPRKDSNDYKRNVALKTYNEDSDTALSQGIVKYSNEKQAGAVKAKDDRYIVALDNKKFWDEACTKKNFGYGKPFPVRISREILGIADGSMVKAYGDVNVVPGGHYELLGKINETSGALYINSEIAPKLLKTMNQTEIYDMVFEAAKVSDMAMDVAGALETDAKGTIMVKGYALQVTPMSNGKHRAVLNSGYGDEITVFPADDNAEKVISEIPVSADVIAIGQVKDPKDTQFKRSMTAIHVVVNPKTGTAGSKVLENLKSFEF